MSLVALALGVLAGVVTLTMTGQRAPASVHRASERDTLDQSSVPSPPSRPFALRQATAPVQLPIEPATVATAVVSSVPVYAWPDIDAPVVEQLANPNDQAAPLVLLALARYGGWLQTYLPQRPNESTGWVPLSDVALTEDQYHIAVSLGARQLTVYDGDTTVFTTSVAPGAPSSPTPTGSFYVTEIFKLTSPDTAYGPYALGTSAYSNTYYSFDGGPGQIAIHGTNEPWLIGGYASHGCVRLANAAITTVAGLVPQGTPVEIGP